MCKIYKDVDDKHYNLSEAIKVIPYGNCCYRKYKDEKGEIQTELCPFLDWLQQNEFDKEEDFHCTGFCHLLMNSDFSNKQYGKEIEHIQLSRTDRPVKFNSKQEPTDKLWDCKKNCQINLIKSNFEEFE